MRVLWVGDTFGLKTETGKLKVSMKQPCLSNAVWLNLINGHVWIKLGLSNV